MGHLHRVAPNNKTTQEIKFETNSRGQILDANTKEVLEPGKMDRGHKYGFEERVMRRCAEKCHMSQENYRNMMQNPRLYQWESSYNNRSGKFECKDFSVQLHNCMEVIRNYYGKQRARATPKFKATEFSPKQKNNSRNLSVKELGSVRTAKTSRSGFWSAKGSLSPTSRSSTRTGHGNLGGNHGGGKGGHGSAGSGGHGGFNGEGHGGHGGGGRGGK